MSNNKYKILVVEDDHNILSMIQTVLDLGGYQVLTAQRCQQGILMLTSHMPDLVVLDLGLPDMDGAEFIRVARRSSMIPIIVLSARSDEQDKVSALDLGANDYITKPFGTGELLARVRASLRINRMNLQASLPNSVFILDDLEIDYDRRQVGKVMTYSAIINSIWGTMDDGSVKKLQVNMANIRKKLGCKPGENKYIINELGVGYRMLDEHA